MLSGISVEDMSTLNLEELQAIGALLNYLRELAEEKKNNLAEQLKVIQVGKNYLG
ncbi:hypothetical protein THEYE_A1508 [Thermodesulfovibrio yellowstonii DSM 11347]|uniref:Uncharacterized protein n=2 Tax=Thermodesulfovibrionaceae TaxID=2811504 RepID=B5YGA7_THEYD|nr:hypothetical protein THEYE_A1508 [Thermodesulfovibrio yellowstonii DSM 11347]